MRAIWRGCCGTQATSTAATSTAATGTAVAGTQATGTAVAGAGLALILATSLATGLAQAACAPAPAPVLGLDFASRYAEGDATASQIDPETATEATAALRPVDDFLRDLTGTANAALQDHDAAAADCAIGAMAAWARADALADLGSETARLTVGARLAGFALVLLQTAPLTTDAAARAEVRAWLTRRLTEQTLFWEDDAPDGARQGNLRAWAALAAAALSAGDEAGGRAGGGAGGGVANAEGGGDAALRYWAVWSDRKSVV